MGTLQQAQPSNVVDRPAGTASTWQHKAVGIVVVLISPTSGHEQGGVTLHEGHQVSQAPRVHLSVIIKEQDVPGVWSTHAGPGYEAAYVHSACSEVPATPWVLVAWRQGHGYTLPWEALLHSMYSSDVSSWPYIHPGAHL
jgi:hypothetical protein